MTTHSSIRRRRSSSRHGEGKHHRHYPGGLGLFFTTGLLAVILMTGPIVLGAARLWIELPLLGLTGVLLLLQGLRLAQRLPEGAHRWADAIDWTVVLFVLYTIARWLTSPTEYFSRIEALEVVGYAAIFFTCRYGMAHRKYALLLLYLLVVLGVGETIYGYWLSNHLDFFLFGPAENLQLHYAPRWLGTYGCPNHYGSLLVMALGAALALGSLSKLPWPVRIVLFYVAIMMMVGVIYSASRGTWIALVVAIVGLVIFGIRNGTMKWWIPITGAAVLAATSYILFTTSPIARERWASTQDLFSGNNFQTYIRVELARDALLIAHDHPLFGTGPGTFVFVHPRYQDSTFGYKAVLTHDDYLNCLDDYGLVGFALALVFVALVTLKFFRPLDIDHRWHDRVLVATGFAAWAAYLAHSWVDFNLHIPANAMLLFALTGLGLSRLKVEDSMTKHWSTLSLDRFGRGLGWAVVGVSVVFGVEVARTAASDLIYEPAFAQMDEVSINETIIHAQDALAWDRGNANALLLLGDVYRNKSAIQTDIEGRLEFGQKSVDAYKAALKANPLDDTIQARMGMAFDVMRRFPEAFFCYQQAVTEEPYNGQFWYRLGNHFWGRSMWAKAEEAYLKSMSCPHGAGESGQAEAELRRLPEMEGVPLPKKGTNPLRVPTDGEEPATLP
jgi:O-antigen ligase